VDEDINLVRVQGTAALLFSLGFCGLCCGLGDSEGKGGLSSGLAPQEEVLHLSLFGKFSCCLEQEEQDLPRFTAWQIRVNKVNKTPNSTINI
jgi:hypothetical protein